MKAKKVFENINFERGLEPKKSLGLGYEGKIDTLFQNTMNAYSFNRYSRDGWRNIITFLVHMIFNDVDIYYLLDSKIMRWAADYDEGITGKNYGEFDLNTLISYANNHAYIDEILLKIKSLQENKI